MYPENSGSAQFRAEVFLKQIHGEFLLVFPQVYVRMTRGTYGRIGFCGLTFKVLGLGSTDRERERERETACNVGGSFPFGSRCWGPCPLDAKDPYIASMYPLYVSLDNGLHTDNLRPMSCKEESKRTMRLGLLITVLVIEVI